MESQTIDNGAAGEANVGVTPQVGNSDNSAFRTARGIWIKTAIAQTTGKMLSKANVLGVKTTDINSFLTNQANLRTARASKGNKC